MWNQFSSQIITNLWSYRASASFCTILVIICGNRNLLLPCNSYFAVWDSYPCFMCHELCTDDDEVGTYWREHCHIMHFNFICFYIDCLMPRTKNLMLLSLPCFQIAQTIHVPIFGHILNQLPCLPCYYASYALWVCEIYISNVHVWESVCSASHVLLIYDVSDIYSCFVFTMLLK
jgi:hypothetical protein